MRTWIHKLIDPLHLLSPSTTQVHACTLSCKLKEYSKRRDYFCDFVKETKIKNLLAINTCLKFFFPKNPWKKKKILISNPCPSECLQSRLTKWMFKQSPELSSKAESQETRERVPAPCCTKDGQLSPGAASALRSCFCSALVDSRVRTWLTRPPRHSGLHNERFWLEMPSWSNTG